MVLSEGSGGCASVQACHSSARRSRGGVLRARNMAPFDTPTVVLSGFKERPESLLVQGNS